MGLGRTGQAAYQQLKKFGDKPIAAMDSNPEKIERFRQELHLDIYYGDAEDVLFWEKLQLGEVETVLLCLPELEAKLGSIHKLKSAAIKDTLPPTALMKKRPRS